jgi:anti-sigma factor ChrR (cupin superfamily)
MTTQSVDSPNADEFAALYAAGALTEQERVIFETRLSAGDPEVVAAWRSYELVVTSLADGLPPISPPAAVRDNLLRRTEGQAPLPAGLFIQRAADAPWEETGIPGVRRRILVVERERRRQAVLLQMAAGATYPAHTHDGPEECFVLEGDLEVAGRVLGPGDYQRAEAGSHHGDQYSRGGCLALILATARL